MIKAFIHLVLFIFFTAGNSVLPQSRNVPFDKECVIEVLEYEKQLSLLDTFVEEPLLIKTVTVSTDIIMDHVHLLQTIGLQSPVIITSEILKKAVFYLVAHKKFKTIRFVFSEQELEPRLHLILDSEWTFDCLKIKGPLLGADVYVRLYTIKSGDLFDKDKHVHSIELIKSYLKEKGYVHAHVHDTLHYDADNKRVVVTLDIEQKELFKIRDIDTYCVESEPDLARSLVKVCEELKGQWYTKDTIERAISGLRDSLVRVGFYLTYENVKEEIHNAEHCVDLAIYIEVTNKRKFIFHGNSFFSSHHLLEQLLLFGKAAWLLPVEDLAEYLVTYYKESDFLDVVIEHTVKEHENIFTVYEGKQKKTVPERDNQEVSMCDKKPEKSESSKERFGKTVIQNSSRLPLAFVARELTYHEREPYTLERVKESSNALRSLGIFNEIELYPISIPFAPSEKTMVLKIHDDDPYELRLRVGCGLQQINQNFTLKNVSYVMGGSFLVKNPFNQADQIQVEADCTHGEQNFYVKYACPWIKSWPLKSTLQAYVTRYLQPGLRHHQKNLYSFIQEGIMVSFNYKKSLIDAQINLGLEWLETKVVDLAEHPGIHYEITRALNFEPLLIGRKIPYFLCEPTLFFNMADNKLNPSRGSLTLLSAKGMIPLHISNAYFFKFFVDHAFYIPLRQAVLACRLRGGHIFYENFKNVMPAERFYLGGANSIRSYQTDMCPPLGVFIADEGKSFLVPQGARSMVTLNIELRLPLYTSFWIALFQDLGMLSNNNLADIHAHTLVAGSGFGVRYATPIGPLRFDIAWKWRRPDSTIPFYAWFLSFGNAF